MPRTKLQDYVFTFIMVFFMVFCMTVYSISLQMGGFGTSILGMAIREMWLEYVIVFIIAHFFVSKSAVVLAKRIIDPAKSQPIFFMLAVQSFMVCQMVPLITLIATFLHGGAAGDWFGTWIQQVALCFPVAFCLQIFYVGPLVRLIFRTIFKKQLAEAPQKG